MSASNELKLSNGDTLYFPEFFKGKHYRAVATYVLPALTVVPAQPMQPGRNQITRQKTLKPTQEISEYIEGTYLALPHLVDKGVHENGEEFRPDLDYYDELSLKDADLVTTKLNVLITDILATKTPKGRKKKS